ncbi:ROK family protein [Patescibacteria group bacterium]|nr:ROK family protein [Patescibacteria group bacterium]
MAKDYYIIGIDVGATKINTVLMNKKGKLIKKLKIKTKERREEIVKQILDSINFVSLNKNKKKIIGIGIGLPGILNKKRTEILNLPNLSGWGKTKLKDIIERKTKKKVILENDSNCMALGENMFGYGKNVKNFVCLTIGTGIGGGIIINNKIYSGRSNAGEFGHITIDFNGYKCKCGARGCLEEYVSARGIDRIVKSGNKKTRKVYEIAGTYLGVGLAIIAKLLDPDLILIGGGISSVEDFILKPAVKEMKKRTFFKACPVNTVKLKDNAGAIGAACLFLR